MPARPKRRQRIVQLRLTDEQRDMILTLIANLIGDKSRIDEMGHNRILPEYLPLAQEWHFPRAVLRVLYLIHEEGLAPDLGTLRTRLGLEFKDVDEKLQALLANQTPARDVVGFAFALSDWMTTQRLVLAVKELDQIANGFEGTALEKFESMMAVMQQVAPRRKKASTLTSSELNKVWAKKMIERRDAVLSGKPVGPVFPWKSLQKLIPNLKRGELCTIMAKLKHGKSTLGVLIAEHIAHVQGGYNVLFLHLETSAMSIGDRIKSRELWVRPDTLRTAGYDVTTGKAKFDIEDPKIAAKIAEINARTDYCEEHMGHLWYHHCPGAGPDEIKAVVAEHVALSEAEGRELVVILDYYQQINWSTLADRETEGFNALGDFLKNLAEEMEVYLITFAQFNPDEDYKNKKTPYNGARIVMRSQVVIRLERDDATDDLPWMNTDTKQQHKDRMGIPIFYHKAGEPSSFAVLRVLYANDDATGEAPVRFTNGYFRVTDVA